MFEQEKRIPNFQTEQEEREFWEHHDSTEFVNWNHATSITFPNLQSSQNISNNDGCDQD